MQAKLCFLISKLELLPNCSHRSKGELALAQNRLAQHEMLATNAFSCNKPVKQQNENRCTQHHLYVHIAAVWL